MLNRANIQIVGNSAGDGGGVIQTCLAEIGNWNMDTTAIISPSALYWSALGICGYKVVDVQATIRADANVVGVPTYPLGLYSSGGTTVAAGSISWTATGLTSGIVLQRTTGGHFDSVDYNCGAYNRGWAVIRYSDTLTPPIIYSEVDMCTWATTGSECGLSQTKCTCIYTTPAMSVGESYCLSFDGGICVGSAVVDDPGSYGCIAIECNSTPICDVYLCSGTCAPLYDVCFPVVSGDTVNVLVETSISNVLCADSICAYVLISDVTSIAGSFQIGSTCTDVWAIAGQGA